MLEVGTHCRIVVAVPENSGVVLADRVMDEVAEEAPLIVDGVVDAEQVFAHVGRNFARGRSQLIGWLVGRSGNILQRVEEQSVGIEQRTRNGVIRERLAWPLVRHAANLALKAGSEVVGTKI